jgi:N-acetylmuramoyl-L-alanine amidase
MKPNEFLVLIDAGHGGLRKGVGTDAYVTYPSKCAQHKNGFFHSYGWFFEGVFNRSLAAYLEQDLLDYGFTVKKVYENINDTSLSKRCAIANNYAANFKESVLISIHGNAAQNNKARGWEIFTSPGITKADSLASSISLEVQLATPGWIHRFDKSDGTKEANFAMLRQTNMPAVLSENGFFTNYDDAKLMIDKEWQQRISKAHAKGVLAYALRQGVSFE